MNQKGDLLSWDIKTLQWIASSSEDYLLEDESGDPPPNCRSPKFRLLSEKSSICGTTE